jgi:hypothetical protein
MKRNQKNTNEALNQKINSEENALNIYDEDIQVYIKKRIKSLFIFVFKKLLYL